MDEMKVVTVEVNSIEKSFFSNEEKLNYVYDYVVDITPNDDDIKSAIRSHLINRPHLKPKKEIQQIVLDVYQEHGKTIEFNNDAIEGYHEPGHLNDAEENHYKELRRSGEKGINTYKVSINIIYQSEVES